MQCGGDKTGEGYESVMNVILSLALVLSVIGNGFVCLVVARHYQLHTVTNVYIVNMAVGQLLLALVCAPSYLKIIISSPHVQNWLCTFHRVGFVFFGAVSCLAFLLVAVERYIVITSAGRNGLSHGKTTKLILLSWVLAAIHACPWAIVESDQTKCEVDSHLTCVPLLLSPQATSTQVLSPLSLILCYLLPITLMAGLYVLIRKPLWRGGSAVRPLGAGHPRYIRYWIEIKTTRTMLIILTLFLASWIPYCGVSLHNAFKQTRSFSNGTYAAVVCLAYVSSCLNPLVYALRNPRFSVIMRRNRHSRKTEMQVALQLQARITSGKNQAKSKTCSLMPDTSRSDETTPTTQSSDIRTCVGLSISGEPAHIVSAQWIRSASWLSDLRNISQKQVQDEETNTNGKQERSTQNIYPTPVPPAPTRLSIFFSRVNFTLF